MNQVKAQQLQTASRLHKFMAAFFMMMTIIFLAVPYALSRHPGDPIQKPVATENNRQN